MIDFFSLISLHKIGWTAMHFLWLSGLFTGIMWLTLKFVKSATLRYRFAQLSLVVLLLLPVALWIEKPVLVTQPPAVEQKERSAKAISTSKAQQNPPADTVTEPKTNFNGKTSQEDDRVQSGGNSVTILSAVTFAWMYPYLGGFWLFGGIVLLGYYVGGMALITRKTDNFVPLKNNRWQQICAEISAKLDIARPINLVRSDETTTPSVVGTFRPSIWIPSHLVGELNDLQIRALLTHELVHIKRGDYLAGLMQHVALSLLFIQPMAWWLVKVLQGEREFICDEQSVEYQRSSYDYADMLLWVKKNCSQQLELSAAAGIKAAEHQLTERIRRLTSPNHPNEKSIPQLRGLALLLLATLFGMGWTTYQLEFDSKLAADGSGITVELTERIPNPYNGGGMAVLLPWRYLDQAKRRAAVLPQLDPSDTKTYARVTFRGSTSGDGSEKVLALFVNPKSQSPAIYLDKNRNLNFTDDGGPRQFTTVSLVQEIPNSQHQGTHHLIRWSTMRQEKIEQLQQRPAHWSNEYPYVTIVGIERLNHTTGQWQYNGQSYSFTLIDRNLNGVFGEPSVGFLAVTKTGNRSLSERTSHFLYQKPILTLGNAEFKVTDIESDGSAIRLKKAE